jgi:TPR repeat protein
MTPDEIEDSYNDDSTDIAWTRIQPLAEAGNPVAQFYMGHLCDEVRDQSGAVAWYRKAAEQGYLPAKHYLASFIYYGMGTSQDIQAALALFREAGEQGDDASQWRLGAHLISDPRTREEGLTWLRRARAQGHIGAIELLAKEGDAP